ncbi:MAG TPA: hypothetical protein VF075_01455 [Pyrinomonadaceae bacterium]
MSFPHLVLARFYEHIQPIDRGVRYEDPLQAVLESKGLGSVSGGGSLLNKLGGIDYVDVEIELANLDEALDVVAETLESLGAPQGSELLEASSERVLREFGKQQCLAIYLDGVSLPDEVYSNLDFDAVVNEIGTAAGDDSYHGFWQANEETGLFFFGADAEAMFSSVEPILRRLPIGQNARVVIGAEKGGLNTREVRMARH